MKILRSVNRRGCSTESIGFYTVLRPNKWFAASRLPGSFHYLSSRFKGAALTPAPERKTPSQADSRETTIQSQIMNRSAQDHRLVRPALIVLAAIAIPLIFLWLLHAYP